MYFFCMMKLFIAALTAERHDLLFLVGRGAVRRPYPVRGLGAHAIYLLISTDQRPEVPPVKARPRCTRFQESIVHSTCMQVLVLLTGGLLGSGSKGLSSPGVGIFGSPGVLPLSGLLGLLGSSELSGSIGSMVVLSPGVLGSRRFGSFGVSGSLGS